MTSCPRRPSDVSDGKEVKDLNMYILDKKKAPKNRKNLTVETNSIKKVRPLKQYEFKDLPVSIFNNICGNISVNDIMSLSLTCSTIKGKVEARIYKHMRIIDIDHIVDEDELIIQKHFGVFKDESLEDESWWVYNNISNIKTAKNILYLVYNILTNPVHGKYLKTIEINPILKPSPWRRCKTDSSNTDNSIWNKTLDNFLSFEELEFIKSKFSFFNSNLTLFDCLSLLLSYTPNLERLIVSRFSLPKVSELLLKTSNLKELKIMIYEHDEYVKLPLNHLLKLEKLRIKFQENTEPILEKIALNFNDCKILKNLICLQLRFDKTDFNHLSNPTWFSFFKPLLSSDTIIFEKLIKFELKDCFFGSNQKEFINQLSKIIPFNQIQWLSLQIYEYSHEKIKHSQVLNDNHSNHLNTVLSYLSPKLKNLKEIRIKPTKNCKDCQINSILLFLTRNKYLKNIWLNTDTLNKENYLRLLTILQNYDNLEKLAYFDEFINVKLINNLKNWFIYKHSILDFDIFKNYESESLRQDIDPLFDCYIIDEFKNFNERELDLLVLFWQQFLNEFNLNLLIGNNKNNVSELKLFGYNFKVDRSRKVILLYISKVVGYVDLAYYN
jgi:hypothetical protein